MTGANKDEMVLKISPVEVKKIQVRLVGDSPLIVHKWAEKAKKELLESYQGKTNTKIKKDKEPKNPVSEFIDSMYWLTEEPKGRTEADFVKAVQLGARWGFPLVAIKEAATASAYRMGWVKNQMGVRGAFFLESEFGELAEIKGCKPYMREDMVKIGMGAPDLRYRGCFEHWYMDLTINYNASNQDYSLENIVNMINNGGYCCGIGEWRPEKDGIFGRYHIETVNGK